MTLTEFEHGSFELRVVEALDQIEANTGRIAAALEKLAMCVEPGPKYHGRNSTGCRLHIHEDGTYSDSY